MNECSSTPYFTPQSVDDASYFFEMMKHQYKRSSRIERVMNPSKSFPVEDSYINLVMIETKHQQEKEKKLSNAKHNDKMMDTFEEIYNTKKPLDVKDIFEYCKNQLSQVVVFGRARIGKTTFCRHAAHQWARGTLWPEYDLGVPFSLRLLTKELYPALSSGSYSLSDVLEKQYFSHGLSKEENKF